MRETCRRCLGIRFQRVSSRRAVRTDRCVRARRVCACVKYASACDESSGRCACGRVFLHSRSEAICPAQHRDKRYIIIIIIPCVVGYTFYQTKIITSSNRSAGDDPLTSSPPPRVRSSRLQSRGRSPSRFLRKHTYRLRV